MINGRKGRLEEVDGYKKGGSKDDEGLKGKEDLKRMEDGRKMRGEEEWKRVLDGRKGELEAN
jgi:hypothetical protein